MDLTGRFVDVARDYQTRKPMVRLLINEEINGLEEIADKDLKIKLTRVTKPRSLDSNAYFHVLCDKLRSRLNVSMSYMKNHLITSYGQMEYIDDGVPVEIKSNIPFEKMREIETPHLKFIKMSDDGNYLYLLYRGSHTYNVQEMNQLLTGTVQEAKDMGIETASPDELRKMAMLMEQRKGE